MTPYPIIAPAAASLTPTISFYSTIRASASALEDRTPCLAVGCAALALKVAVLATTLGRTVATVADLTPSSTSTTLWLVLLPVSCSVHRVSSSILRSFLRVPSAT